MRGQRGERDERKEDRRGILHKLTSILLNLGDPLKLFLLPVLPTCFSSLFYLFSDVIDGFDSWAGRI